MLYGFGFLQGWGLAPLTGSLLDVEPMLLVHVLAYSALIFGSFSVTALVTRRRAFLAWAGWLSAAFLVLAVMSIVDVVYPTGVGFDAIVYGGLLLFAFLISLHTQAIVESVEGGGHGRERQDSIGHAAVLFSDLLNVFVRLAIILLRQQHDRQQRDRAGRARKRSHHDEL